jgi:protein-S-isoprenylcysteine O-methyltransferase Ste14
LVNTLKIALALFRHLVAIIALPFTVAVIIPAWIARVSHRAWIWPQSLMEIILSLAGSGVLVLGLALFLITLYQFAVQGKGTLAPWDPPRRFVVRGLYRYVRNPMISGVTLVLLGEALLLRSLPQGIWVLLFFTLNMIYIPFIEEPQLEKRFGEDYVRYKKQVPRFIPRRTPWDPSNPIPPRSLPG